MSAFNQICFTDEANCLSFVGHMLKANMCTSCMKDIAKHNAETVKEEDLIKALEYTQRGEKTPTLILKQEGSYGQLFLGGFKAALNSEFLQKENVHAVVNTAGSGLFRLFGKKLEKTYLEATSLGNLVSLFLEWEDSISYDITDEDFGKVINFIHEHRQKGGSVLVHCAQGKSRSSTAVVAYIMAVLNLPLAEAYSFVQKRRKMAEPNAHFMFLLHQLQSSDVLKQLRQQLSSA